MKSREIKARKKWMEVRRELLDYKNKVSKAIKKVEMRDDKSGSPMGMLYIKDLKKELEK